MLNNIAWLFGKQERSIVLVIRKGTEVLHEERPATIVRKYLLTTKDFVVNTGARKQVTTKFLNRNKLLIALAIRHHQSRTIKVLQILGPLKIIINTIKRKFCGRIIVVTKIHTNISFGTHDCPALFSTIIHSNHGKKIARVLVTIYRSPKTALKAGVPYANAIHGHVNGVVAHTKLNIIATDKERNGQAVLQDRLNGNAAIPPCAISLRDLDILTLI